MEPAMQINIDGLVAIIQVIAAFAAFAAFAAWRAATASEKQATLFEEERRQASRPDLQFDVIYYDEHAQIRLRNVGGSIAKNIRLRSNADSLPSTLQIFDVFKSRLFRQGLPSLTPQQEWSTAWTGLIGLGEQWVKDWGDEPIEVELEYTDASGKDEYFEVFSINPAVHLDALTIQPPDAKRHAEYERAMIKLAKYVVGNKLHVTVEADDGE